MTRYEEARKSPQNMSIMVAFCIAAYLVAVGYEELDKESNLRKFLLKTSEDVEKWLKEDMKKN